MTSDEAFSAAVALHQQGRLDQAESIYQAVLRAAPRHAGALHLLGLARFQRGDLATAARLVGDSIAIDPRNALSQNNLGAVLLALRRPAEALGAFERALSLNAGYAEAIVNSGNALVELARPREALERYDRARSLGFANPTLHYNRGVALHRLGRLDEALAAYGEALALAPDHVDALANRGEALRQLGRREEALASFDRAIALAPERAQPHNGRGTTLFDSGRLEDALACYDRAIAADPGFADAHGNRANLFLRLRRFDEALESSERALAARPDHPEAMRHRAAALLALARYDETIEQCDRILGASPDDAPTHYSRGMALLELYRREEALPSVERALALDPALPYAPGVRLHLRMHLCEWEGFDVEREGLLRATRAGERCSPPFAVLALGSSPQEQRESARILVEDRYPPAAHPLWRGEPYRHDRVRIGYFSADFHNHATAHLVAGVLEHHDRSRFEVTAFSFGPDLEDAWRRRVRAGVDRFLDVAGWTDERIAALAREHEIDIAVDLKGLTAGARTGIFALRPAPVQVNYLGYPGSMGAPYIDYLIADATVVPEAHEDWYAEKIVRLPDCYQANDSSRAIADRAFSRAELGLPEAGFVFCCFNNAFKITPDVFAAWMRLLRQVPGSALWLLAFNRTACENLRREARERGVDPERLVFAPVADPEDHLARHRAADLFLDTFHYNAHTTASDALWAGLPVVTLEGPSFPSRVASSLLRAVGLPELVADTPGRYEALALELATSPQKLAALRGRLAAGRTTAALFDTARFTRHIEAAFREMHGRQLRGLPPERIVVGARTP